MWKPINFHLYLNNLRELINYAASLPYHTLEHNEFANLFK